MTDAVIDAIDLVAQDDGPEAAAKQAAHELGVETALAELSGVVNGAFGARHDRLAAVLSEVRKLKRDGEQATEVEA
jgi:hypothetical protein